MAIKVSLFFIIFVFHSNLAQLYAISEKALASEILHNLHGGHKGVNIEGINKLKKYLHDFGYIKFDNTSDTNITSNNFDDSLESALKKYQSVYKLNVTGVIDDDTISLMSEARCGMPDFPIKTSNHSYHTLYKFFPGEPKWWTLHLTYEIAVGTAAEYWDAIEEAFGEWSRGSQFVFALSENGYPNLRIKFDGIDGDGGVLAVAYRPRDGHAKFDIGEKWVDGAVPGGFDLKSVALHEIGHLLGLAHSDDKGAVMYPYFKRNVVKILGGDDILGLSVLYGYKNII